LNEKKSTFLVHAAPFHGEHKQGGWVLTMARCTRAPFKRRIMFYIENGSSKSLGFVWARGVAELQASEKT
jgi:hypothetical protein